MPKPSDLTIPDQSGRTAVVTGANSGLGFHTASRLAAAGAAVILACRNLDKAEGARSRIAELAPGADVRVQSLNLSSLDSVRAAADELHDQVDALDLLINNAGVMAIPRATTADGFEMQIGTNHLGHFALTGLLLDLVLAAPKSRIVSVSSSAHKGGRIRFDDLQGERRYQKWRAYQQSKLANLLFTYELQMRLAAVGAPTIAVAAHPGWAATNLQTTGRGVDHGLGLRMNELGNRIMAQSDEMGALPTLYAATSPDVVGGGYYGPDGPFELRGMPERVQSTKRSHDVADARRLWDVSEALTGVRYDRLATAA
jgi:NAD(P)-dependent dehydrogenase (short-subunit alcohol dehydrogenase family)